MQMPIGICLGQTVAKKEVGTVEAFETFAQRITELREKQHRSRKVVSELCGLPPDAIRRYERREAKPSFDAVLAIADYFGVSVDYLMGRVDYKF